MPNNESPHATHHTHYLRDDDDGVGGDVDGGDGDGGGDGDIDNNLCIWLAFIIYEESYSKRNVEESEIHLEFCKNTL